MFDGVRDLNLEEGWQEMAHLPRMDMMPPAPQARRPALGVCLAVWECDIP